MWFFGKSKEVVGPDQFSLLSSKFQQQFDLAWQWISFLQSEVQRANSNVQAVHINASKNVSNIARSVPSHDHVRQTVESAVRESLSREQALVKRFDSFEHSVSSSLASLRDSISRFEPVISRVERLESDIPNVVSALDSLRQRLENSPVKKSSLQERVERKIRYHGKDFLKQTIRGMVQKYGRLSGLQLREMLVDEQGLCSKSSLYRILEELESEFKTFSEGREKIFIFVADSGR
ncbi:hypothetical protein HY483_01120 [Candidatus Woesearchaeota archaeon]|nr:hypothetical protein [Candidatus Woesearchaeota archaeon]